MINWNKYLPDEFTHNSGVKNFQINEIYAIWYSEGDVKCVFRIDGADKTREGSDYFKIEVLAGTAWLSKALTNSSEYAVHSRLLSFPKNKTRFQRIAETISANNITQENRDEHHDSEKAR